MDDKLKGILEEYVATANSGKYSTIDEVNSKFPELKDYDKNILEEYVATANSGKYNSLDEVNSKFPELFPKPQEVSPQGSGNTSQTSTGPVPTSVSSVNKDRYDAEKALRGEYNLPDSDFFEYNLPKGVDPNSVVQNVPLGDDVYSGSYIDPNAPVDTNRVTIIPEINAPAPIQSGIDEQGKPVYMNPAQVEEMSFLESASNSAKNIVTQIRGIDDRISLTAAETWEGLLGKEMASEWYKSDGRDINKVKIDAVTEINKLSEEMKQVHSITGGIDNGSLTQILAGGINAVSSLASSAVAAMATGGVGTYTEMVGSNVVDYNNEKAKRLGITVDELYKTNQAEFKAPATLGVIAGALEKIGLKGVQKSMLKEYKGFMAQKVINILTDQGPEAVTEWLQTGLEGVNTRLASNEKSNLSDVGGALVEKLFSKEGLEAALGGFVGSAGSVGLGKMAKIPFAVKELRNKFTIDSEGLMRDSEEMLNQSLNPSTRLLLEQRNRRRISDMADAIQEDAKVQDKMSSEKKAKLGPLFQQVQDLAEILSDDNISDSTRKSTREEYNRVSSEIDSIYAEGEPNYKQDVDNYISPEEDVYASLIKKVQSGEKVNAYQVEKGLELLDDRLVNDDTLTDSDYDKIDLEYELLQSKLKELRSSKKESKLKKEKVVYDTPDTSIISAISQGGSYSMDGNVGTIATDDKGAVTFETADKVYDLGNINDIKDDELRSFGLKKSDQVVPAPAASAEVAQENDEVSPEVYAIEADRNKEIDALIKKRNEENPSYEYDAFSDATDSHVRTLNRVDDGLPVDPYSVQETRDYLYGKAEELMNMKNDPDRQMTISEIDETIAGVEEDINKLENLINNTSENKEDVQEDVIEEQESEEEVEGEDKSKKTIKPAKQQLTLGVATVSSKTIESDPERFQYKSDVDETGVSDKLKGRTFNPDLAGVVTVWKDPEDGKTYVVNGHHRLDLAKAKGVKDIDVRYIHAENADEARTIGALQNITEGQGSDIDAAKVFRSQNATDADLKAAGISLSESKANNGLALAQLSDKLFNAVTQGKISPNVGIAIGTHISNPDIQEQFWNTIKGKNLSLGTINVMAQDMNSSKTEVTQVSDLFGTTEVETAAYEQRASLIAQVRNNVLKTKNILGKVANNKEFLEAYGNKIDNEVSSGKSREAATAIAVFDALRNSDPSIKELINLGIERIEKGAKQSKISAEIARQVVEKIPGLLKSGSVAETAAANNTTESGEVSSASKGKSNSTEQVAEKPLTKPAETKQPDETKKVATKKKTAPKKKSAPKKKAKIKPEKPQGKTPKGVLEGVVNRLKKTGLAKSVKIVSSDDVATELADRGVKNFQKLAETTEGQERIDKGIKELVVVHNISSRNLMKTLKAGAMPAPSIAITGVDSVFDNFGEVTLLGDKELIDPKKKGNKVYSADVYSPRYPNVNYKVKSDKPIDAFLDGVPREMEATAKYSISDDIKYGGFDSLIDNNYAMAAWAAKRDPGTVKTKSNRYSETEVDAVENTGAYDFYDIQDNINVKKALTKVWQAHTDRTPEMQERFIEDGVLNDNLLRTYFNAIKKSSREAGQVDVLEMTRSAREYIDSNGLREEFNNDMNKMYQELNTSEQIFKDYDKNGNPKYVPNTPENALKEMKKEGFQGTEGGFQEGVGAMRGKLSPVFKSIKDIQNYRDNIVSSQEFDAIKDEYSNQYDDITSELNKYVAHKDSSARGFFADNAEALAKNGVSEDFKAIPKELQQKIADFVQDLKNAPTEYFEAKPERVVGVNEFNHAVIPSDAPQELKTSLTENGIPFTEYSNAEERLNAVRNVSLENDVRFQNDADNVSGFVDNDGNVVINEDVAGIDTPIHEFAHLWSDLMKDNNPELHAQGMGLIKGPEGQVYVDMVRENQPDLEGEALYEEALVQAIGQAGETLINSQKQPKLREWLKAAWEYIGGLVGLSGMNADKIANLTLDEFARGAAVDLLGGKKIVSNKDGSVDMAVSAPTEAELSPEEKRTIELMNKFKSKAGISFQKNQPSSSSMSSEDLRDLIELAKLVIGNGTVATKEEFKQFANSIGINDMSNIDFAYNLATTKEAVSGIKVGAVDQAVVDSFTFDKMTLDEVRQYGRDLVDSGALKPSELVDSILENNRALQPYEVAALIYYKSQLDAQIANLERTGQGINENFEYGGLKGDAAAKAKLSVMKQQRLDFDHIALITGSQQSMAFRLRAMMVDKDFNIVEYIQNYKSINGGYIDPKLEAELTAYADDVNRLTKELAESENKRIEAEKKIEEDNIKLAAKQAAAAAKKQAAIDKKKGVEPPKPKVRISTKVRDAVSKVVSKIDPSSFGLTSPKFQKNNTVKFSKNAPDALTNAVSDTLNEFQNDIDAGIKVGEAIEAAIERVNAAVGASNWDSASFRSQMVNSFANEGAKVNVAKPYVGNSGSLIVPGKYLQDLVNSGIDTIEGMVAAVHAETNNTYDDYSVRNAISGYGKTAVSTASETQRKVAVAKRIARKLSELEDLKTKGARAKTPRVKAQSDSQIDALEAEIKNLERLSGMTPEEYDQYAAGKRNDNYNERRRTYIDEHIQELEDKIANKDFAPKGYKPAYEKDQETLDKEKELLRIKNKFKEAKTRVEFQNRSKGEKVLDVVIDILNIARTQAGGDLSSILVQGGLFAYSNPVQAAKILGESKKAIFSNEGSDNYFEDLQSDPLFELARKSKLNLQLPSFYNQLQEEQFNGNLMKLIIDKGIGGLAGRAANAIGKDGVKVQDKVSDLNPWNIADRHYSYTLSATRMYMFKKFLADAQTKGGLDVEVDADKVKRIASLVNDLTFASSIGGGKGVNKISGLLFYSLPKAVATFKLLSHVLPHTFFEGATFSGGKIHFDPVSVAIGKQLYSQYLLPALALPVAAIGGYLMAGAAIDAGDEDDKDKDERYVNPYIFNPKHTDFMKIMIGNTRISTTFGMESIPVLLTRLFTNEYMTSSSSQVKTVGSTSSDTRGSLLGRFIVNKFAPAARITYDYLNKTDDQELEYGKLVTSSIAPMWISSGLDLYEKDNSLPLALTLGMLGSIGVNYNTYGGAEYATKVKGGAKSKKVIEDAGISVYNPTPKSRSIIDVKSGKEVKVGKVLLDKEYLPIYSKAMDDLVYTRRNMIPKEGRVAMKEGAVNQMKKDAYKYAQLEMTGVISGQFESFSNKGKTYKLLPKQYLIKKKFIDEYMNNIGNDLLSMEKEKSKNEAIREGYNPTPGYVEMDAKRKIYLKANTYANKQLKRMIVEGTLEVVETKDYKDKELESSED